MSCGTVEYRENANSHELLAALARDSGLALVRVERSAVENGPACEQLDFDTEYEHYLDAFEQALQHPAINTENIYVYGSSLGAMTAPLIAKELQARGHDIEGIMVQGGGALTYFERMFAFDRMYLERRPDDVAAADIHDEMLRRAKFQHEYLVAGRHPDEIAADSADMAAVRADILGLSDAAHYGRPFAWHQQLARRDALAAWVDLRAPVLVIFNAFDQFESRHGHELIAATVNRLRPGTAVYIERENIGHSDNRYATIEDAYAFENGVPAWQDAARIMLAWLAGVRSPVDGATD